MDGCTVNGSEQSGGEVDEQHRHRKASKVHPFLDDTNAPFGLHTQSWALYTDSLGTLPRNFTASSIISGFLCVSQSCKKMPRGQGRNRQSRELAAWPCQGRYPPYNVAGTAWPGNLFCTWKPMRRATENVLLRKYTVEDWQPGELSKWESIWVKLPVTDLCGSRPSH